MCLVLVVTTGTYNLIVVVGLRMLIVFVIAQLFYLHVSKYNTYVCFASWMNMTGVCVTLFVVAT